MASSAAFGLTGHYESLDPKQQFDSTAGANANGASQPAGYGTEPLEGLPTSYLTGRGVAWNPAQFHGGVPHPVIFGDDVGFGHRIYNPTTSRLIISSEESNPGPQMAVSFCIPSVSDSLQFSGAPVADTFYMSETHAAPDSYGTDAVNSTNLLSVTTSGSAASTINLLTNTNFPPLQCGTAVLPINEGDNPSVEVDCPSVGPDSIIFLTMVIPMDRVGSANVGGIEPGVGFTINTAVDVNSIPSLEVNWFIAKF